MNAQRQIWVPSTPKKRSRQEIAEIDGELLTRTNRFGGGYQPLEDRIEDEEQKPQQPEEIEEAESGSEGESKIIRGDNFPIVDLKTFNTEGKEAQFIQINQVINKVTGNKKATGETIKKAEFNFMLDLKTLIAKSATDAELNRVRDAMRRNEKNTAPEAYRTFGKLSNKWGLTFNDDRIVVPNELRKKLMETLHFGHAGYTKMTSEAKIFWWPNMQKEIEEKTRNCVACMASGKNLKCQNTETRNRKIRITNRTGTRKSN